MQNNQIPDSALRASTSYNTNSMGPGNGRLHFQATSGKYGSWAVSTNNDFQYFEVNFGDWTQVTKVATQGRQDGAWWTKSYSLAYSYDGVFFEDYKEDNVVKVTTIPFFKPLSDKNINNNNINKRKNKGKMPQRSNGFDCLYVSP